MFTQNPKIIFYHIFACVRAEEEKLKLMLQLDEVQLRLKSVEFITSNDDHPHLITKTMKYISFTKSECLKLLIIICSR